MGSWQSGIKSKTPHEINSITLIYTKMKISLHEMKISLHEMKIRLVGMHIHGAHIEIAFFTNHF